MMKTKSDRYLHPEIEIYVVSRLLLLAGVAYLIYLLVNLVSG